MIKSIKLWYKKLGTVPLYIGGMIPPGSDEAGTLVNIYECEGGDDVVSGYSDINGEFHARIPKKYIGNKLFCPVRHVALSFDHEYSLLVQPWGVFHAVKMSSDYHFADSKSGQNKAFNATQEYLNANVKVQYAARNEVSRTKWLWLALALGLITSLLMEIGIPKWAGYLATIIALVIRTILTKRILGLTRKPLTDEKGRN